MFRLSFALAAVAVLTLINLYTYRRFLRRLELFARFGKGLLWGTIAVTLCEILYFAVLRLDALNPLLFGLFSSLVGISFMLFCVAIVYDLIHVPYAKIPHDYSRRLFVKTVLDVTMLLLAFSYMLKGFINGFKAPVLNEKEVFIDGLGEALRVVQLSDVHLGKSLGKTFLDALVSQINTLNADIVVITGDLVDMPVANIGNQLESLRTLKSRFGVYFVPGNHEYFYGVHTIMEHLEALGVKVLKNRSVIIDERINLVGVTDMSGKRFDFLPPDLPQAFLHVRNDLPTVLLSHQPKIVQDLQDEKVDLIISGHTHGGQIFPFGLLVLLDQPYLSGLYRHSTQTQIFVSNGAGYWGPPVRVMAPSEIALLRLKAKV